MNATKRKAMLDTCFRITGDWLAIRYGSVDDMWDEVVEEYEAMTDEELEEKHAELLALKAKLST